MNNLLPQNLLSVWYDPEDLIGFSQNKTSQDIIISMQELCERSEAERAKFLQSFAFATLRPYTSMNGTTADLVRNILIEFDDPTIAEQVQKITSSSLPYSSIVFSGHRSLHVVISLVDKITSDRAKNIASHVKQFLHGDICCHALGRTRLGTPPQHIMKISSRVLNQQLYAWLTWHPIEVAEGGELGEKWLDQYIITGGSVGQSHNDAFKAACTCLRLEKPFDVTLKIVVDGRIKTTTKTRGEAVADAISIVKYVYDNVLC